MTCAILARCDGGGLAALTREVHRHLTPARTLLLDLEEQGRGECVPDDFEHGDVYRCTFKGSLPDAAIEWVTAPGIDVLFSAETFYDDRLIKRAHQNGIRTIVYAMPELAPWNYDDRAVRPRAFTAPTHWRLDTLPANTAVLPMPIARDRLPYSERKTVEHLYHTAGKAMLDRNGTELLLAALPFIVADGLRLTIRGPGNLIVPASRVDVTIESTPTLDYWDSYPSDIDLNVLPRRYGGLCMPVIECASLGVPSLMLQTDPYAQEGGDFVHAIPSTGASEARMKGGRVPVQTADPRALAGLIDFLVAHPDEQELASLEAGAWAESHSWEGRLGERWRSTLDA